MASDINGIGFGLAKNAWFKGEKVVSSPQFIFTVNTALAGVSNSDQFKMNLISSGVNFGGSKYTSGGAAEAARTSLISKWGAITDGGAA